MGDKRHYNTDLSEQFDTTMYTLYLYHDLKNL